MGFLFSEDLKLLDSKIMIYISVKNWLETGYVSAKNNIDYK